MPGSAHSDDTERPEHLRVLEEYAQRYLALIDNCTQATFFHRFAVKQTHLSLI